MRNRNPAKQGLEALSFLHPDVQEAIGVASDYLAERAIPHTIIGGAAINVHGYAVNTQDVDILIPDRHFFSGQSRLIAIAPGPTEYRGKDLTVRIDYLSGHTYPGLPSLEDAAILDEGIPVVELFPLLYMKLSAWRPKDQVHVVGLLNAGSVDLDEFRQWLRAEAKDWEKISKRFDQLVERAEQEP